jgi:hypothetical protein
VAGEGGALQFNLRFGFNWNGFLVLCYFYADRAIGSQFDRIGTGLLRCSNCSGNVTLRKTRRGSAHRKSSWPPPSKVAPVKRAFSSRLPISGFDCKNIFADFRPPRMVFEELTP